MSRVVGSWAAALTAATLLVAMPACGGGGGGRLSKAAYEQKLQAEARKLTPLLTAMGTAMISPNPRDLLGKLEKARKELRNAADELASLRPPADAVADNKRIAETFRRFDAILSRVKSAAANGDAQQMRRLLGELQSAGKEGQDASNDLKKKGYHIGAFGG
jgi:hypothetical protein